VEEEYRKEDDQEEEGQSVVCGIHFVWFVFSNSNMMAELTNESRWSVLAERDSTLLKAGDCWLFEYMESDGQR